MLHVLLPKKKIIMKRSRRTNHLYASIPKLRIRTSNKIQNEEDNTLGCNNMKSIISHDNTLEHIINTEETTSHFKNNDVTSHSNTSEYFASTFEEEDLLDLTIEEVESSLNDSYSLKILTNEVSIF